MALVKNPTAARCVCKNEQNEAGLVMTWTGAVSPCAAGGAAVLDGWPRAACEATAWRIDAVSWESGVEEDGGGVGAMGGVDAAGEGPLNMASIVGRSAAPSGVERKFAGRSENG